MFTKFQMQTDDARNAIPQIEKAIKEMEVSGEETDALAGSRRWSRRIILY